MMNTSYTPQAESLAGRICAWFRINREEELTQTDIATKFEVLRSSITPLLDSAVGAGLLTRKKDPDAGVIVYSVGPKLLGQAANPLPVPVFVKPEPKPKQPRKPQVKRPPIDCAAIVIEEGVTPPAPKPATSQWNVLLGRLKPNSATEPIPKEYRAGLAKAAQIWAKSHDTKLSIRAVDDAHIRLYRLA